MIGRFFILGAISTLIDYVLYAILVYFGVKYYIAIVVGYGCGFLYNFFIGRSYVFENRSIYDKIHHEFLAVFLVAIVGVILNIAIVWLLSTFGINYYLGRVVALVIVFFVNYLGRRMFVYK